MENVLNMVYNREVTHSINYYHWLITLCLFLFAIPLVLTHINAEERMSAIQEETNHYSNMLAHCMNGEVLLDSKTQKAYFCGKVIEVPL